MSSSSTTSTSNPILLLTDPGRDCDDLLALVLLNDAIQQQQQQQHQQDHQHQSITIVGIICSGSNSKLRCSIIRHWINIMKWDSNIPIQYTDTEIVDNNNSNNSTDGSTGGVYIDSNNTISDNEQLLKLSILSAAELITSLCIQYSSELIIICIAPLTPLAAAIQLNSAAVKSIKSIYIQGQCYYESNNTSLLHPDFNSFNLREDSIAANLVFTVLSPIVEFHLLGKYTAYSISLSKSDLLLNSNNNNYNIDEFIQLFTSEIRGCMNIFRIGNSILFNKLYYNNNNNNNFNNNNNTAIINNSNNNDWFDSLDIISHPYDPLLILSLIEPVLFQPIIVSIVNSNIKHYLIGMTIESTGIINIELLHSTLVKRLQRSLININSQLVSSRSVNNNN